VEEKPNMIHHSCFYLLLLNVMSSEKKIIKRRELSQLKERKEKKASPISRVTEKNRCYKTKWSHFQNNASHAIYIRDYTLCQ